MICDFHIHSSASPDCAMQPERIVSSALAVGLDAIAVCDHNTIAGALAVRDAAARAAASLLVVVGSEIKTRDGEVIGLFLSSEIPPGLTAEETVAAIAAQGGVVVVPHPFDRYRSSAISGPALERIAESIDAIEGLNARNLRSDDDKRACVWAAERAIPCVAGSDAHSYREIGRVRTELPAFTDAMSLREALSRTDMAGRRSSALVHVPTVVRKRLRWG